MKELSGGRRTVFSLDVQKKKVTLLLLLVLVGIGLFFRLDFAGGIWNLTFDEIFSVRLAEYPISELLRLGLLENSPPLFYILLRVWITLFGSGDIALRSLPLLASLGAIPVAYLLQKELWRDSWSSFAAAFFVAVSPFAVFFGREVRMYPLIILSVLAAFLFSFRYVRTSSNKDMCWYVLCIAVAAFLHYGVWFVVAIHSLVFIFFLHTRKKELVNWLLVHGVLAIAMLSYLFVSFSARSVYDISVENHWSFVSYDVSQFFPETLQSGLFTNQSLQHLPATVFAILFVLLVSWFLLVWTRVSLMPRHAQIRPLWGKRIWLLSIVFLPMALGWIFQVYSIKFFVGSLALLPLFFAQSISTISIKRIRAIALGLVAGFSIFILIRYQADYKPVYWENLVAHVESQRTENDLVLIHNFNAILTYEWYAGGHHKQVKGFYPPEQHFDMTDIILYNPFQTVTEETVGSLEHYTEGYSRVFFVNERGDDATFWNAALIRDWFVANGWKEQSLKTFSNFKGLATVREYVKTN